VQFLTSNWMPEPFSSKRWCFAGGSWPRQCLERQIGSSKDRTKLVDRNAQPAEAIRASSQPRKGSWLMAQLSQPGLLAGRDICWEDDFW
jgi:hypothetical protein